MKEVSPPNGDALNRPSALAFVVRMLLVSLRARWRQHAAMSVAVAIGMFSLGLSVVAGLGIGRSAERHLTDIFPSRRVVLRPRALSLIWLQVETANITTATLRTVRALPGVARVSPEATIRFPICAVANLLGSEYGTDITVTGVESWLLGEDAPKDFVFDPESGREMPAVLSQYFLDLYNMSLSESNDLPKLTPQAVVGRHFDLILGASSIKPAGTGLPTRTIKCVFSSLSHDPDLVSLVMPLEAVETFNRWYGFKEKEYRALHVELESAKALETLKAELPGLGLELRDDKAPWQRAMVVVRFAGWGIVALGSLVFILSLGFMTQSVETMLGRRQREMALFRALGASAVQVASLATSEIALASALGICVGVGGAGGLMAFGERWYQGVRTAWTFLPPRLFAMPWSWLILLALACWMASILLSLGRVWACARRDITTTLNREG